MGAKVISLSGLDYFERCFDLEGIINFFFGVHATLLSNIASSNSFIFSNLYSGSRRIVMHVLGSVSRGWCSYRYGYGMLAEYTCFLNGIVGLHSGIRSTYVG